VPSRPLPLWWDKKKAQLTPAGPFISAKHDMSTHKVVCYQLIYAFASADQGPHWAVSSTKMKGLSPYLVEEVPSDLFKMVCVKERGLSKA